MIGFMTLAAAAESSAQDDFIPAPASSAAAPASAPPVDIPAVAHHVGLDTTHLIVGAAIVLVIAGVLLFVRGGIKSALVSAKASLDAANFAGWSWYLYALLLSTLIVFGLLGGVFGVAAYTGATVVAALLGLIVCLVVTGGARNTRK